MLLPALNPDVVLIHVQRCDAYGNAQLDGLQFMDIDMAMAANRVILTTERIVSNDQIRRTPDQTRIPVLHGGGGGGGADRLRAARVLRRSTSRSSRTSTTTPTRTVEGPGQGLPSSISRSYYYEPKSWPDYLAKLGMDGRARCVPPRQERPQ